MYIVYYDGMQFLSIIFELSTFYFKFKRIFTLCWNFTPAKKTIHLVFAIQRNIYLVIATSKEFKGSWVAAAQLKSSDLYKKINNIDLWRVEVKLVSNQFKATKNWNRNKNKDPFSCVYWAFAMCEKLIETTNDQSRRYPLYVALYASEPDSNSDSDWFCSLLWHLMFARRTGASSLVYSWSRTRVPMQTMPFAISHLPFAICHLAFGVTDDGWLHAGDGVALRCRHFYFTNITSLMLDFTYKRQRQLFCFVSIDFYSIARNCFCFYRVFCSS